MPIEYAQARRPRRRRRETATAQKVVTDMLAAIAAGGEKAVRDYARKLDQWSGDDPGVAAGDRAAHARHARGGARPTSTSPLRQVRASPRPSATACADFSIELLPGLIAGQKLVPVNVAGCYVPTGRYAHIASAYMSIATAKAAGVQDGDRLLDALSRAKASIRTCSTR